MRRAISPKPSSLKFIHNGVDDRRVYFMFYIFFFITVYYSRQQCSGSATAYYTIRNPADAVANVVSHEQKHDSCY